MKRDGKFVYVCEDGTEVPIKPISVFEVAEVEEGIKKHYRDVLGEPVDPPTYEVKVVGGGSITCELTAEILIVEDDEVETARRQLAWGLHQKAIAKMDIELNQIRTAIVCEGIDVPLPEDDAWVKKLRRRYIEVPDDLDDRAVVYKMTQVIKTPVDLAGIQAEIFRVSTSGAIKEEQVEAAKALFRSQLQEQLDQQSEATGAGS